MHRVLVVFEPNQGAGMPATARAVARGAADAGAEVRVKPLADGVLSDVDWADSMALGLHGCGAALPAEARRWLDTLGASGWRAFEGKPGCIFTTRVRATPEEAAAATRLLARILRRRGMLVATPEELGLPDAGAGGGRALGRLVGAGLAPPPLPPASVQQALRTG